MPSSTSTLVSPNTSATSAGQPRHVTAKATVKNADKKPVDGEEYEHFFWTYTEEPHRTRRQAIIKAHPEVLYAVDELEEVRTNVS